MSYRNIHAAIWLHYVLIYPYAQLFLQLYFPPHRKKKRQLYNMVKAQLFPRPQRVRHRESDMTRDIPHIHYQYSSHVPNRSCVSTTETTRWTMFNIYINLITPKSYKQTSEDNIKKIPKAGFQNVHYVKMSSLKLRNLRTN